MLVVTLACSRDVKDSVLGVVNEVNESNPEDRMSMAELVKRLRKARAMWVNTLNARDAVRGAAGGLSEGAGAKGHVPRKPARATQTALRERPKNVGAARGSESVGRL